MENKWYKEEENKYGYVAESGLNQYNAIVPENIDSSTHVVLCSCNPHDFAYFSNYVKENACDNTVYIVIGSIQDGDNSTIVANNYAGMVSEIIKDNNIPQSNVGVITWSNGNKGGSYVASSLYNDYNIEVGTYANVMGNLDGAGARSYSAILRKTSNTNYLYFDDHNNNYGAGRYYESFKEGNSYVELQFSERNGSGHNFYKMNDQYDIIGFVSGTHNLNLSDGKSFRFKEANQYENGVIVKTEKDSSNVDLIINKKMYELFEKEVNIEKYGQDNSKHVIKTIKDKRISDKYSNLKELEDLHLSSIDSLNGDVRSDLTYVEEQINKIRSQIKQNGFLQGVSKQTYTRGSEIPGCINDYLDRYYDIVGNLIDLIESQTEAIMSFAQAYVDMDMDMKNRLEEISDGTYIGNIVEQEPIRKNMAVKPSQKIEIVPL